MIIERVTIENVLRIEHVEIVPDSPLVVIGGDNSSGKTSVLSAIRMALCGERHVPPEPLRRGAEHGRVTVVLSEDKTHKLPRLAVTRTFRPGKTKLDVRLDDVLASSVRRPQKLLDKIWHPWMHDPMAFASQVLGPEDEIREFHWSQSGHADRLHTLTWNIMVPRVILRVLLIGDTSYLDARSGDILSRAAGKQNAQFWIERVGYGDECLVVMTDGRQWFPTEPALPPNAESDTIDDD